MTPKKVPMRRCIGCMQSKEKRELIRLIAFDEDIIADPGGRAHGRGAYICPDQKCLDAAIKKNAFRRNLGAAISEEACKRLSAEIERASKGERKPEVQ